MAGEVTVGGAMAEVVVAARAVRRVVVVVAATAGVDVRVVGGWAAAASAVAKVAGQADPVA